MYVIQVPKDWTTHTHRIGRTGRAGTLGSAYTLLLPTQSSFAALLVRHIEEANGLVDPEILRLALNDGVFKREREGLSSGSSTTTTRGGGFHRGRGRGHNSFCTTPRPGSSSGKPSRLDGFSFNLSSNGIKFQKASSSSSSNSHGTGTG